MGRESAATAAASNFWSQNISVCTVAYPTSLSLLESSNKALQRAASRATASARSIEAVIASVSSSCICSVSIKTGYAGRRHSKWENKQYRLVSQSRLLSHRGRTRRYSVKWSLSRDDGLEVAFRPTSRSLFIMSAISGRRLHRDSRPWPSSFLSELHLYKSLKTPPSTSTDRASSSTFCAPERSRKAIRIAERCDRQISVCGIQRDTAACPACRPLATQRERSVSSPSSARGAIGNQ